MRNVRRLAGVLVALAASASFFTPSFASGGYDVPTGAPPSPLEINGKGKVEAFTQEMILFEEMGVQSVPSSFVAPTLSFPAPDTCDGGPNSSALSQFLGQPLFPAPTEEARVSPVSDTAHALNQSPWKAKVSECVRPLANMNIEGRPPGQFFAHQRWSEFAPQVYVQTAQAGARVNDGFRDAQQRHHYTVGEFGVGGLYHGAGSNAGAVIRLHPNLPVQDQNSIWTFDGTLPPKLVMARYGEPLLMRHYNALPIALEANNGFGEHTISTHMHNGHNPGESDGFTGAYFFPGQYYDYRWPMALAGYDSINTGATDTFAGRPDGSGGVTRIRGDWHETMSSLWFHDHMIDGTAQNVYKGNAAMINLYSAIDRGREGFNCRKDDPANNANLCLPSGTGLDWGNRDYDINLVYADKAWDSTGQLYFNKFNTDGFIADRATVNWLYKPFMNVRARRYRFRMLNGSVSRLWRVAVVTAAGARVPFYMVANDGNIMEHAVKFPNAESQELPTQGVGERFDIVVDFAGYKGQKLYLVNLVEHKTGRGPEGIVPLSSVMNNTYAGDPAVGKFLEFRVTNDTGVNGAADLSMNPADFVEGKLKMIPLPAIDPAELATARHRTFVFGRGGGTDGAPWNIKTDNGTALTADVHRITFSPEKSSVAKPTIEVWTFSGGGGWAHPVHSHFEEVRILSRDGGQPRSWERLARKDIEVIGNTADLPRTYDVAIRMREFMGTFVEHCHTTQHEDHAMLLRWDLRNPGSTLMIPTPVPDWEGVSYEDSIPLKN